MNKNELDLLRSYADGPKIWDATSVLPTVYALEELGLIERTGAVGYLYQLTDEGRRAVRHDHGPVHPPGTVTNCMACVRIREAEQSAKS